MEHYNKMLKETEIENIFEEEFNDSNNKIKEVSPTCNILSSSPTENMMNTTDEEDFSNAMKEQWWFDIFDPNNSQFDVIFTVKRRFIFYYYL
jgi:hypothetical protein